jgi:hypothetical protein
MATTYISPNKPTVYAKFQNFAPSLSPNLTMSDPVEASVYDDIDTLFDIGPVAYGNYGPQTQSSQLFMAERCSKNFDGACHFLSENNEVMKGNMGKVYSPLFSGSPYLMTVGDGLVDNSAQRRFCDLSQCNVLQQNYNPLDPSSPLVSTIVCGNNNVVCKPPPNPDDDVLLNKVLERPEYHVDLLMNMYRNAKNDRQRYNGTRIGNIFNVIDNYYMRNRR